jgi:hypothetical protein
MVKRWRVLVEVMVDTMKGARRGEAREVAYEKLNAEFSGRALVLNIEEVGDVGRGEEGEDSSCDYPLPAGVVCDFCG